MAAGVWDAYLWMHNNIYRVYKKKNANANNSRHQLSVEFEYPRQSWALFGNGYCLRFFWDTLYVYIQPLIFAIHLFTLLFVLFSQPVNHGCPLTCDCDVPSLYNLCKQNSGKTRNIEPVSLSCVHCKTTVWPVRQEDKSERLLNSTAGDRLCRVTDDERWYRNYKGISDTGYTWTPVVPYWCSSRSWSDWLRSCPVQ